MRAANVALIDVTAAVNDAFIGAAAANDSFEDESAALDAYAATLDQALEARRVGLETAVNLYAGAVVRLMRIAAYDQLDFLLAGFPALGAMGAVQIAVHEAHHDAREGGFQVIQDPAYNATGERERFDVLDTFAQRSPALLAAIEDSYAAADAANTAAAGVRDAFLEAMGERKPPRHGDEYARAVLAATDPAGAGGIREAALEAAREAYATSPKAAFDAAFNVFHGYFSSGIASVPTPTPVPR